MKNNFQIQILLVVISFKFGYCVECYHCPNNFSVSALNSYSSSNEEKKLKILESLKDCDVLDDTTWTCINKYCRKEVRKVENGSHSEFEITWRLCSSSVADCTEENGCHFCRNYLCNESSKFAQNLTSISITITSILILNKMRCF